MCYIVFTMAKAAKSNLQVGVRELRQNLSVYLARVKRGESLEVTEHGRPVARLGPLPAAESHIERLIAEGQATRPVRELLELGPPPVRPEGAPPLSVYLAEQRRDRL